MAGTKALNVRMNFQVDTTQARQQIQQLGAQLNSITKPNNLSNNIQLGITSQIIEATKAASQLKVALTEAINPLTGNLNLSKFNDQLNASGMKLSQYRDQLASLGTVGNQTFNSLARSIMTAETPLLRTGKAAQQMWTVLGNTVRWQATSSIIHGIMSTASQAMNYIKSLDNSLNNIRIVTGQSQEQMERFARTANEAAKQLNTSTNEYAKASLIYYQQGLSNKEVEARTATTIKLANVAGESAAKVSDQLTAVWNNFYDGSKSLEYYADVMTALGASTASSTDEIAKGLEKFSSIAKTTGLSYEYATSALSTVVAATRQSADSVGTSFKTLFSRLQGLSLGETLDDGTTLNKYSKALNTIGVNIKNANGSLKDMDDILNEIGERWTSLTKAEQVALAQTVGGARNYTGLVSLMDNWDDFQVNLKTAQQAQGTLQNQADIYAESWEAASKHVKTASETIYKNLLDDQFFKGLTNGFGSVLDIVGQLTTSLGGFKGSMLTIGNAAFQLFGPQIAQSFANIGLNVKGMTKAGRSEVLQLKEEAMNAIASKSNFSQYDNVNILQQQYGKAFNQRQLLYEDLLARGKISDYERPAYQMLFNAADLQNDAAIQAAEQAYQTEDAARLVAIRGQQRFNYQLRQNPEASLQQRMDEFYKAHADIFPDDASKNAFKNYIGIQRSIESGKQQGKNLLGLDIYKNFTPELYQEYKSLPDATEALSLARNEFSSNIKQYGDALFKERIASNIQNRLGANGITDVIRPEDALRTAGYISRTIEGAEKYGIALGKQIPILSDVNKEIQAQTELYNQGKLSQEEYNNAITKIFTNNKDLSSWIESQISGGENGSGVIEEKLINQVQNYNKGMSRTEAESQVRAILNAEDKSVEKKMEAIDQIGGAGATNKAVQEALEQTEKLKRGIDMSSAITTNLGAMAALGQGYQAVANAAKVFKDENAGVNEQIGAFTSLAMSGTMMAKPLKNFFETAPLPVKAFGKELGITNGALGGIMAAVTALTVATNAIIKDQAKNNITNVIKDYNTSIATAQQLTSNAKSAYDELVSGTTTHNNLLEQLNNLQQGTSSFTNALYSANEAANNLIEKYDLVYGEDYTFGNLGEIKFDQQSLNIKIDEQQQKMIEEQNKEMLLSGAQKLLVNYDNRLNESYIDALEATEVSQYSNKKGNYKLLNDVSRIAAITEIGETIQSYISGAGLNVTSDSAIQTMLDSLQQNNQYFSVSGNNKYYNLDQLKEAFSSSALYSENDKDFLSNIYRVYHLMDQSQYSEDELATITAQINDAYLGTNQYDLKQLSILQSMIENAGNSYKSQGYQNVELASMALTNQLSAQSLIDFAHFTGKAGTKTLFEGIGGRAPKDWYRELYGENAKSDMSDEEIATRVKEQILYLGLTDTQQLSNIANNLGFKIEDLGLPEEFLGYNKIFEEIKDLNLPNIMNLSEEDIQSRFMPSLQEIEKAKDQQYENFIKNILNTDTLENLTPDDIFNANNDKVLRELGYEDFLKQRGFTDYYQQLPMFYDPKNILEFFDSIKDEQIMSGTFAIDDSILQARQQYADHMAKLYDNQRNELAKALLINFDDGNLDAQQQLYDKAGKTKFEYYRADNGKAVSLSNEQIEALTEQGLIGKEFLTRNVVLEEEIISPFQTTLEALTGKLVNEIGEEVGRSLQYGELQEVTNALINANGVGKNASQELVRQIIENRALNNGAIDSDMLAVMRNYNYENSISAMYANSRLQKNASDTQRDKYIKLFSAQIEDIDREKGWFQMLYNSSGFSDVLEKIQDQFNTSGQISAEYITKLADKSETLSQFLQVSADSAGLLNVNAGGLASVFEELSKGTITTSDVNSTLMSAMSTGSSRSAANAAAFEVVDNLDLGRSGLDFLDYFQDMAKQMYQAEKAGWGFYSDPIQNIIDKIGGDRVRAVYNQANSHTDWSFKQMWDFMSSQEDSKAFMNLMDTMAGRKGKGGGGPADIMKYYYDVLGGKNKSEEDWKNLGFKIDSAGNFYLDDEDNRTQEELIDVIKQELIKAGFEEEEAYNQAQVIMGTASTSGTIGYMLDERAAQKSYQEMLTSNTPMSEQQRKAWFNQYGNFITGPDGKPYKSFEDFDANYTGNKGWAATNKSDWDKITNVNDLVAKAKAAGTTFTDIDGSQYIVGSGLEGHGFNELAQAYGAALFGGHGGQEVTGYNYDKLVEMIESMNGTEADLQRILEDNEEDFKGKIYGKNAYGREIKFDGDEFKHLSDFIAELNKPKAQEQMMYNNLTTQGSVDVFQGMQQLYWENPETGEVVLDPYGTKRNEYQKQLETNSAELRERAEWAQKSAEITNQYSNNEEAKTAAQKRADTASYAADMYDYQHLMSTEQRQAYLDEARKQFQEDPNKLTPFQKSLLSIVDDINTGVADQLEIAEQTENGRATGKGKTKVNEEGQLVDEDGNPIELPQDQQPQGGGTNGGSSGDTGYGNGRGGNTGERGSAKTGSDLNQADRNQLVKLLQADPTGTAASRAGYSDDVIIDGLTALAGVENATTNNNNNAASGQNNARPLAYASGKEGHIAVTGELGPELRVKSDGSMDILGKTGREYAWIEPDDKIYTAVQSAGILKSNKIPELEGLAKGINNFIPGYAWAKSDWSSSGSGGGGSSGKGGSGGGGKGDKDPRYDPNTLKIRDILERYYTILQQVDDITKAVEHIGKAIDRGWGQERIKNLERQEKLLESQYKMQEAYVKEIKDYLKVDKDALSTMVTDFVKEYNEGKEDKDKISLKGAIYDENGVLTNYKEIVQKLVDAYNKNADANAQSKEEQYKFQERLKDIQMYTDTLNQLQEAEEKLYDLNNQILDTRIRQITYRIEYENEMDANDLKLVNFQYDQIADNAYRTAEAIDLTAQKSSYLADELHRYENGITEILGKYFDRDLTDKLVKMFYENPTQFAKEWQKIMETDPRYQDITDEHKNTLEGWMDRSIEIVKTLWDNYDKTIDKMSDDIKTFSKTLDGVLDKFDYFNSVYDSLNNIIGLTNRSLTNIDAAFMKTLSDRQLENSMNKFRGAAREVQTMNKAVAEATLVYNNALAEQINYTGNDQQTKDRLQDEVDNTKKALDIVIEQNENATKQFYDAWENCLKAIEERYKVAMQEVGRDYERSISPYFMTLELLQNQYDREKELADLYVKDYQRIHDLSKLNRDIQKSIDDTDNLKGKQRLRDLQKEINDLQENGNDLSEYDLDILQKKYDLELARQALEDAKDAKSLVRLTRDNNGNWSYVYTSNQDDVDEAEQNYEDKIRDMEQANEDYIREMQDQIVDLTAQARQALEGLNPADFASPEEFQEYLNNLIKYYQDRLNFATSQLNNATGNNTALAPDIQRMYNNLDHNLTTNPGQTILSAMFGTQNLDDAVNNIIDGINNMAGEAFKTYATVYSEMQKEVYEIAGVDIANAASGLGDIIDIIAKASTQQVEVMDKEATRIDDAYTDTINAIQAYQTSLADLIGETNTMTNSLSSLNTFLHSSGEYVPTNTLYEKFQTAYKNVTGFSSGGYTGRWQYADTGMYTGEWPDGSNRRNGRLAWLHQKELVLNAHDTENFLDAMEIVRQLDNLTNWMANGLGDLVMPNVSGDYGELEQNVHIEAEFPNVTDHNEIEQAFTNLVNMASQYANRK